MNNSVNKKSENLKFSNNLKKSLNSKYSMILLQIDNFLNLISKFDLFS